MPRYQPSRIEPKWQDWWGARGTFASARLPTGRKAYILDNSMKSFNADPKREFIREKDLLGEVLVEGPPVIEGSTLDQIAQLVRDGALVTWRTATTGDDGKIDLCERVPQIVGTPASVPVAPPLDGVGSGPDVAPA